DNLAAANFEGAADLTRSEVITAVQTAIWGYANSDENPPVKYSHTFHLPLNAQWGQPVHDFTNELLDADGNAWWEAQKVALKKAANLTEDDYTVRYEGDKPVANVANDGVSYGDATADRINRLIAHLKGLTATYPEKHQIVISKLEIKGATPVIGKDGAYQVALQLALNNSGSCEDDEIAIDVYVNDELAQTKEVELGTEVYDLLVEAPAGALIKAVVSGSQILPQGAYFYAPSVREESQSLVGVAEGKTDVHAEGAVTLKQDSEVIPTTATLNLKKVNEEGKALTGAEFALYVNTAETSIYVGTYAVDENGQLTIGNLLPNNYELRETKAPAGYAADATVAFTVNEDGIIVSETAEITEGETGFEVEVINYLLPAPPAPETTEVYVAKQWVGDTAETRPASVDVQLLRNGVVYDTVTLTANNGWSARWFNLDIDATWTVAEASVPTGYTASVAQNGNSFVITNTFGVELPEPPVPLLPSAPTQGDFFIDDEDVPMADVPATGDPLTVMAAMSALSAVGVYFTRKKRDEE
ncbi:MAG: Cna B-type domain-containing protein, partial [Oscillospiraceae bacterium]|nr:Cna B-type domain-containing protein [Oscillospiraceae bacterium]